MSYGFHGDEMGPTWTPAGGRLLVGGVQDGFNRLAGAAVIETGTDFRSHVIRDLPSLLETPYDVLTLIGNADLS